MLDSFVYGEVQRISPEAPIPVLRIKRKYEVLGGMGNVVRNLSSLNVQVEAFFVTGQDETAETVKKHFQSLDNVKFEQIIQKNIKTPLKTRFIAQSQQLMRVDDENPYGLTSYTEKLLIKRCLEVMPFCQVVILSDYAKGTLNEDVCQALIQKAKTYSIPVLIDPKGRHYTKYKSATLLSPNSKELQEVSPFILNNEEALITAARDLIKKHDLTALLVTQGAQGMTLVTLEEAFYVPTIAKEVFDVSGAGDTVIATFAAAVAQGYLLKEAMTLANYAAGIVVGKIGTAVITLNELQHVVHSHAYQKRKEKVFDLPSLKEQIQLWHREGLIVGFTNGCFDLLHLGHLHSFNEAKKHCDRLIVGLNTDDSIKRLKGQERPIQNQVVRSHVLAALERVDAVILFEDNTPEKLIKELIPDRLFKGTDYTLDNVVGADVVQANGGQVILIDLKPGYSTTATVQKLKTVA
ncbi:MAG: bifunctional heptose 7-phosphate kinase/heptose 1-phosphate adenyltransferase [Proteobacteria bacterium]|nr:bifunctional heptose 7-phosphate kinase/heptose 1-phosphate adenyltransferase [Pseudomonadota bacterium]